MYCRWSAGHVLAALFAAASVVLAAGLDGSRTLWVLLLSGCLWPHL
jgi:hypothetical protein